MDQQFREQLEQKLTKNWSQVSAQIIETFPQVPLATVDAARTPEDLVSRISDLTHHSERYVESRIGELVGATTGGGTGSYQTAQSQPRFSQRSGQQSSQSQ